jgi:hypothetical protein
MKITTQITRKLQEKFLFVERWVMCRTLNNGWRRGIVFFRVSFLGSKATSNFLNDAAYREINTLPRSDPGVISPRFTRLDQASPGIALWIGDWTS